MGAQLADQPLSTLTVADLQALIRETVKEVLQEMLSDPDAQLMLRPEFEARLQGSIEYVQSGGKLLSLQELGAELEDE